MITAIASFNWYTSKHPAGKTDGMFDVVVMIVQWPF